MKQKGRPCSARTATLNHYATRFTLTSWLPMSVAFLPGPAKRYDGLLICQLLSFRRIDPQICSQDFAGVPAQQRVEINCFHLDLFSPTDSPARRISSKGPSGMPLYPAIWITG